MLNIELCQRAVGVWKVGGGIQKAALIQLYFHEGEPMTGRRLAALACVSEVAAWRALRALRDRGLIEPDGAGGWRVLISAEGRRRRTRRVAKAEGEYWAEG